MDVLKLSRSYSCAVLMMVALLPLQAVQLQEGENFRIGFEISEGYTAGLLQSDLFLNIDGPVLPQIGNYGFNASQGLRLDPGSAISLDFTSAGPVLVGWIDYYIKPVFAAGEELPVDFALGQAALAGFVRLDALGEVYVLHGDRGGNGVWLPTGYRAPLTDNMATQWLRMTYRLDYANLTWDLFLDGQLSRFDLGFIDPNVPPLTGFSLKGSPLGSTYLDQFEAGFRNPLYQDADNDGMSDEYEQAQGLDSTRDDRSEDADHDGLSNIRELHLGLNAGDPDSDDDGRSDGAEFQSGANPLEADPYSLTVLPFKEDFEAYAPGLLDGHKNWQFDGGLATVVAPADSEAGQFLELTANPGLTLDLSNAFNGSAASIVWTEFDISPIYFNSSQAVELNELAMDGQHSAIFYFSNEPALIAYDGKSAQFMNYPLELDAEAPQRMTLRHDYSTQTWSLWCNAVLVARDLGFAQPQPFYSHLKFTQESEQPATLDNLRVAVTRPPGLDSDGDGLPDEVEDPNANEIRDPGETDPFDPDSDGDGILDSLDSLWTADPVQDAAPLTLNPSGYKTLSFHFEPVEGYTTGPLAGQLGWEAAPVFEVSEDRAVTPSLQSLRSEAPVPLDAFAYARHYLSAEGEPVVWVTFEADMKGVNLDAIPVNMRNPAAAFALSPARRIAAYDALAGKWQVAPEPIPEDEWIRYDLRLDYAERSWSLCANGQMVFHELPFIDPDHASLSSLTLLQQGGGVAGENWIDAIEFSNRIPVGFDFDSDGLDNQLEVEIGSDPLRPDTDGDGLLDGFEYRYGYQVLSREEAIDWDADSDGDGLTLNEEQAEGTNPQANDTDVDGLSDSLEIVFGKNPLVYDPSSEAIDSTLWSLALLSEIKGEAVVSEEQYLVTSSGSGFKTHHEDKCTFLYQKKQGDFEMVTRVDFPETAKNSWRAGVMLRTTLDPQAAMAGILVNPDGILYQQDRPYDGGKVGRVSDSIRKAQPPTWLKIKRSGNQVTQWHSRDEGLSWERFYANNLPLGETVWLGLVVLSGNPETLAGASFSDISVRVDSDSDGLMEDEEAEKGTSDLVADSDGDGVEDYREMYEFFSDPGTVDIHSPITVLSVPARTLKSLSGIWKSMGDGLSAESIRGSLVWEIDLEVAGIYQLAVEAGFEVNETHNDNFEIVVSVDGEHAGVLPYDVVGAELEKGQLLLPWLQSGRHTIELALSNTYLFRKIRVNRVELEAITGSDIDGDGMADWVTNRLNRLNKVDVAVIESATSPYCLTGQARYPGFVRVEEQAVTAGPNERWFRDCDLIVDGPTMIEVTLENTAISQAAEVRWINTPVFDERSALTIRRGDALKLSGLPDGGNPDDPLRLLLDGVCIHEGLAGNPFIYRFNDVGVFEIKAEYGSGALAENAVLTVTVIGMNFDEDPLAVVGQTRIWKDVALPSAARIESDARVVLAEHASVNGLYDYSLKTDTRLDRYLWARVGEQGPILDAAVIRGIEVATLAKTGLFVEQTYPDGTVGVMMPVVASRLPEDLRITLDIFIGGVLFDDGTTLKTLGPADFDPTGVIYMHFLKSEGKTATCHHTKVFQDSTYIGRNK